MSETKVRFEKLVDTESFGQVMVSLEVVGRDAVERLENRERYVEVEDRFPASNLSTLHDEDYRVAAYFRYFNILCVKSGVERRINAYKEDEE
jgi:hypothetical protein